MGWPADVHAGCGMIYRCALPLLAAMVGGQVNDEDDR